MFRRQLAAVSAPSGQLRGSGEQHRTGRPRGRRHLVAGMVAAALICTGCGSTSPPPALGTRAYGPILSMVTAQHLTGNHPRGITQYFAVRTRTVYAAAFLGDLKGATQLTMTWSRLTAAGWQVLFSKELPVTNYGMAYSAGQTRGTLPVGAYRVSASIDGVTRSIEWTVFTPLHTTAASFGKSAAPVRLGVSGSFPQHLPKAPCDQVQSTISMPSTTSVRLVLSAYCPQDHRNGPTRGVVLATMDRNAGEWLVGALRLQHDGMLAGSFSLNLCKLPGGSNRPGKSLFYTSVVYYRGVSKNFSGQFVLPPAHLVPVVIINSSVPAGMLVHPGEKILLHVTAAEPVAFGPELAVRSISVTGPGGQVVKLRRFHPEPAGTCGNSWLRRTVRYTYTVPAGASGVLTLTASATGAPGGSGLTTISFPVGG